MRLTGGADRGRCLASPRGVGTRPTSDRVRESLFNILGPLDGKRVLDLFAGAGTLGHESLSRGAQAAWYVDAAPRALKAVKESLRALGYEGRARVFRLKAPGAVETLAAQLCTFDVVFMDPPYGSSDLEPTLVALGAGQLVAPEGVVVVEHDRDAHLSMHYGRIELVDQRRYGRTILSFFENSKGIS